MSGYYTTGTSLGDARITIQPSGAPVPRLDFDRASTMAASALDPAGGVSLQRPNLLGSARDNPRIGTPGSDKRRFRDVPDPMVPLSTDIPLRSLAMQDNYPTPPRVSRQLTPRDRISGADFDDQRRLAYGQYGYGQRSSSVPPPRSLPTVPMVPMPPVVSFTPHVLAPMSYAPPLPPVSPNLLARLSALEQSLRQQDAHQSDAALSQLLREELWVAQEADKRARGDMDLQYRKLVSENDILKQEIEALRIKHAASHMQVAESINKDIADLRGANDAERREREDLYNRHQDVLNAHQRLQGDYAKLQADLNDEVQAHKEAIRKHEHVNSDMDRLREDLRRQKQAHDAELNCSVREKDEKHRQATEATDAVMRDFQKLEKDRGDEQRARQQAEEKVRSIGEDVARLQTDVRIAEAARDAEQNAKEELQRRHRELQSDLELKNQKLVDQVAELQRNVDQVPVNIQQKVFNLENLRDNLLSESDRLKDADAAHRAENRSLRERLRDAESAASSSRIAGNENFRLAKDLEALRETLREREESEKLLRRDRDSLKRDLSDAQAERDLAHRDLEELKTARVERDLALKKLGEMEIDLEVAFRDIENLRKANEERQMEAQKLRDAQGEFETGVVKAYEDVQRAAVQSSIEEQLRHKTYTFGSSSLNSRATERKQSTYSEATSVYSLDADMSQVGSLGNFDKYRESHAHLFDLTGNAPVELPRGRRLSRESDSSEEFQGVASVMADLTGVDGEADMEVIETRPFSIGNPNY